MPKRTDPMICVRLSPVEHETLGNHAAAAGAPSVSAFATGIVRGALAASSLSSRSLETAARLAVEHSTTPAKAIEAALDLALVATSLKNWKPKL